jgi:hypothetical protein
VTTISRLSRCPPTGEVSLYFVLRLEPLTATRLLQSTLNLVKGDQTFDYVLEGGVLGKFFDSTPGALFWRDGRHRASQSMDVHNAWESRTFLTAL